MRITLGIDGCIAIPLDKAQIIYTNRNLQVVIEKAELKTEVESQTPTLDIFESLHNILLHNSLHREWRAYSIVRCKHRTVTANTTHQLGSDTVLVDVEIHLIHLHRQIGNTNQSFGTETEGHKIFDRNCKAESRLDILTIGDVGIAQIVVTIREIFQRSEHILRESNLGAGTKVQSETPEQLFGVRTKAENRGIVIDAQLTLITQLAEELICRYAVVHKGIDTAVLLVE